MSLIQRSASLAVALACALGIAGVSTPSRAAELVNIPAPIITPLNVATALSVPTLPIPVLPAEPAPPAHPAASPHYASLTDAVAAQVMDEGTDELNCLAGAIYFESKGEPLSGQLAVANVIINRAKSGRYPPDICGVVTQRGQFSFVRGGRIPDVNRDAASYRTALALAKVAMAEAWDSPAPQALYFHARRIGFGRGVQVASIGNHVFYR